jgi:hypothetical protein
VAAAFGLDADADRDLLLGILADIAFPTLRLDGPWCVGWARVSEEYRLPSKPLLEIWISGRMTNRVAVLKPGFRVANLAT